VRGSCGRAPGCNSDEQFDPSPAILASENGDSCRPAAPVRSQRRTRSCRPRTAPTPNSCARRDPGAGQSLAYTEYHERILNVVDICLAVEKICSIDEPLIAIRGVVNVGRAPGGRP